MLPANRARASQGRFIGNAPRGNTVILLPDSLIGSIWFERGPEQNVVGGGANGVRDANKVTYEARCVEP